MHRYFFVLRVAVCCLWFADLSRVEGFQEQPANVNQSPPRMSIRDFVTLEIRSYTRIPNRSVTIADVAQVICADNNLKQAVELIEICNIDELSPEKIVTHRSFRTRLVLAGLTLEQIRIRGAQECKVEFGEPDLVTDQQVELEARKTLCQVMGLTADDLQVQLQTALMQTMTPDIQKTDGLVVKVVPPLKAALGNTSLNIQFWKDGRLLTTRCASFSVRKRFRVAVARASLSREYSLDHSTVGFEERFLTEPADELTLDQIEGRSVKSVVLAGGLIQTKDLQSSKTGKAVAVKKGELVKVIATNGSLKLQLYNVEAMEDGGTGETIQFKNRESGKTFSARVAGPGAAEVRL